MTSHNTALFRFYAELNDFLNSDKKQVPFRYFFKGRPSVKDAIEAIGVPHTEVDLILVNGTSVDFTHPLRPEDRVSVYPVFESLDITPLVRLREKPLRKTAFILDVHLGKLARLLRLLGFDTLYRNDYEDHEIVAIAVRQHRIILTRDRGILKTAAVTHGYWIRSKDPIMQAREVVAHFDLHSQVRAFTRCTACNGVIRKVAKSVVLDQLPGKVAAQYEVFYQCADCAKVYWQGSHYDQLRATISRIVGEA